MNGSTPILQRFITALHRTRRIQTNHRRLVHQSWRKITLFLTNKRRWFGATHDSKRWPLLKLCLKLSILHHFISETYRELMLSLQVMFLYLQIVVAMTTFWTVLECAWKRLVTFSLLTRSFKDQQI